MAAEAEGYAIVAKLADDLEKTQEEEQAEIKAEITEITDEGKRAELDDDEKKVAEESDDEQSEPITRSEEQKLAKIVEEVSEQHQADDERQRKEIDDMISDDE